MANSESHSRFEKLLLNVGRLLSKFTFVAGTLVCYVALCLLLYVWMALDFKQWRGWPATITYDVALGGSPLPYAEMVRGFPFLWRALELFHIVAWLIVPILVATMVDATYRLFEENQRLKERMLSRSLKAWGRRRGMTDAEIGSLVDEALDTFPQWLKRKRKKRRDK